MSLFVNVRILKLIIYILKFEINQKHKDYKIIVFLSYHLKRERERKKKNQHKIDR